MAIPPQALAAIGGGGGGGGASLSASSRAETGDTSNNLSKRYDFGSGPTLNRGVTTQTAIVIGLAFLGYLIAKKKKVI